MKVDMRGWDVLVVDNEVDNLRLMCDVLRYGGANVTMAISAAEAFDCLAHDRFDFMLVDLSMPEISGWDLLAELRSIPKYANMPVIAITADVMASGKDRALAAGFDGYIAKPFSLNSLIAQIEIALDRAARGRHASV